MRRGPDRESNNRSGGGDANDHIQQPIDPDPGMGSGRSRTFEDICRRDYHGRYKSYSKKNPHHTRQKKQKSVITRNTVAVGTEADAPGIILARDSRTNARGYSFGVPEADSRGNGNHAT